MIDLILFAAVFGSFLGGFRCGKTFGTLTEMFVRRNGKWVHPGWHLDLGGK